MIHSSIGSIEAGIDDLPSLLKDESLPRSLWAQAGFWVICNDAQEISAISAIEAQCAKPVQIIHAVLENGGAAFLLQFLHAVNPALPFEQIVEADLEHLLLELHPLCKPAEQPDWRLSMANSVIRGWIEPEDIRGTLCIELVSNGDMQAAASTFSALRLAAYCASLQRSRVIVLDRYNFIGRFANLFTLGGSPPESYLFVCVKLDSTIVPSVSTEQSWEMSSAVAQRRQMIEEAAYFRYLDRETDTGDPVQDWLEAEAEVDSHLGALDATNVPDSEQLETGQQDSGQTE